MKKLTITIISALFLLTPVISFATIGAGWNATSTDAGYIQPTYINGNRPWVQADHFSATSTTATSTFTGPVVIGSGTTGTSTLTIGVAGLKPGCINFVTFNGTTWATSSMYMEGSSVISEANACR